MTFYSYRTSNTHEVQKTAHLHTHNPEILYEHGVGSGNRERGR